MADCDELAMRVTSPNSTSSEFRYWGPLRRPIKATVDESNTGAAASSNLPRPSRAAGPAVHDDGIHEAGGRRRAPSIGSQVDWTPARDGAPRLEAITVTSGSPA